MKKKEIANFFDGCAPFWDDDMIRNEEVIATILDKAAVKEGSHVLDIACGTGVLFPDYLDRNVASITGIDISPEMVKIAQEKFPDIEVICGDAEKYPFQNQFDVVMIYNAFPHFLNPSCLIEALSKLVKPGGKVSIAHGMSREALSKHHSGSARKVSIELLHETELATLLEPHFDVDVIISNDQMYQVTGIKR